MSRFGLILPILCLLIACKAENELLSKQSTLPNIVIIFTDDQGYQDVGVFGSKISTPHLDQMAAEGLKLTNYYAAQAVCSASRAALLTGCYPNRIGIHNALMPNANIGLNPDETTLAELLKSRGYATGIFGKWHLGDHPNFLPTAHGFDEWFGIPYSNDMWPYHPQQGTVFNFGPLPLYQNEQVIDTLTDQSQLTAQITKKSIEFIERNKANPFFLYVPHPQPHVPLFVSERFKGKSEQGLYGDVIMELDWSVGQIMQALEANAIADNTMVIFTSDNGPWLSYGNHAGSALPFREGKGTAWEGGQREPFLIIYPDSLPRGKTIDAPIMAIDLLPTIADVVGAPLPDLKIDGKSAWPLLKGETTKSPQEAYFFYYKTNELHAVRQGDWKLYTPHTYRSMKGQLPGKDGLPGLYRQFTLEKHELYNLSHDPEETLNVANENPKIVTKMMHLADSMRNELGDALTSAKGINNREPGRIE
ncbi:MAG: arylsulfatase [Allomuricauda sp.]|nr:MAG: arylsulfatase [Allomuricauda sp.]